MAGVVPVRLEEQRVLALLDEVDREREVREAPR